MRTGAVPLSTHDFGQEHHMLNAGVPHFPGDGSTPSLRSPLARNRGQRYAASTAFGRADLCIEEFFRRARHIEARILVPETGGAKRFNERECPSNGPTKIYRDRSGNKS